MFNEDNYTHGISIQKHAVDSGHFRLLSQLSPAMIGRLFREVATQLEDEKGRHSVALTCALLISSAVHGGAENAQGILYTVQKPHNDQDFVFAVGHKAYAGSGERAKGFFQEKIAKNPRQSLFAMAHVYMQENGEAHWFFNIPEKLYDFHDYPEVDVLSYSDEEIGDLVLYAAHHLMDYKAGHANNQALFEALMDDLYDEQKEDLRFKDFDIQVKDPNLQFFMRGAWGIVGHKMDLEFNLKAAMEYPVAKRVGPR